MPGGPLGVSLTPMLKRSPYWTRVLTPIAKWYAEVSGYRRMGLKYDDLCALALTYYFCQVTTGYMDSD